MNQQPIIRIASLITVALLVSGCTSLLPRARSESSPFKTFDEASKAIDALIPMQSNIAAVTALGIDPVKQPNTVILTHPDIVRRFVPSTLLKMEDLDPGVLLCLQAREACRGWELTAARISLTRTGNFFADFTNFSRRTETHGWRFNALILMVDDVVVYRAWGGQPNIDEVEVKTNPLGPLQELGPALVSNK